MYSFGLVIAEVYLHWINVDVNKAGCLFRNIYYRHVTINVEVQQQRDMLVSTGWATPHIALRVWELLTSKFRDRVVNSTKL